MRPLGFSTEPYEASKDRAFYPECTHLPFEL